MRKEKIIDFANSYIEGSLVEIEIIEWKLAHHKGWQTSVKDYGIIPKRADLGEGRFNGFINTSSSERTLSTGMSAIKF